MGESDDTLEGTAHRYLLAEELLAGYAKDLGYENAAAAREAIVQTVLGSELEDVTYDRLFDYYADAATWGTANAWRILVDDYVTTADGTGIVHQAPAYGEDDQRVTEAAGIPLIMSLDDGGRFLPQVTDVAGELWMDANTPLVRILRQDGRLLRLASYEHSYPHCWRCRNPLIYKAVSSWFVRVTDFKDGLLENNEKITWVPDNVKHGQFGKWLEGARDWSISRNRYWGSPIPVWKSDDPEYPRVDVYGSLADLERDFGRLPVNTAGEVDLHRPFIDDLTRPNPDDPTGRSTMRRIEDVLDVWFDSASMPYAQVHYPFENHDWFDAHSPADFIVEYIGQTRGWFYVMHVLSTALFDRPAFTGVSCHGIVLGSDGLKMSKSLRNYPDVSEVFDRDGSDAMRWFLMSSSVLRGGNLVVTEEGIRAGVREFMLPLWNAWYFFSTMRMPRAALRQAQGPAPAQGPRAPGTRPSGGRTPPTSWTATSSRSPVTWCAASPPTSRCSTRRWPRPSSASSPRRSPTGTSAAPATGSGWGRPFDRLRTRTSTEAFDTLYTVLETLTRVAAPLIPLVSDRVWQGLTGGRSVHLQDWPDADAFPAADDIRSAMDAVREVSSTANALRKKEGRRVRLPLSRLTVVVTDAAALAQFDDILREELNVKSIDLVELEAETASGYGITHRLSVNARAAGPRLGKRVQQAIQAAKAGEWSEHDGIVAVRTAEGELALEPGEYDLVLETTGRPEGEALALLPRGGFVLLDTTTTPELEAEGLARDLIRAIQDTRKAAGFDVSDRIRLGLFFTDAADAAAVSSAFDIADIAGETLATEHAISVDGQAHTGEPDHRATFAAGAYANAGEFSVSVTKVKASA